MTASNAPPPPPSDHATAAQVARVRAALPNLPIHQIRTNHDGLVNDILIVNDELVFRFPKDATERADLARELKVLALVRRFVDAPIPVVELATPDFVMYRMLPGVALHQRTWLACSPTDQVRLATQVGEFLAQLHAIPPVDVTAAGIGAAGSIRTRDDWLRLYDAVQRELYPLLMGHGREWVEMLFAPVIEERIDFTVRPTLIHGDLGPYHLLFDRAMARLTGVLDFGVSGLGDPADDFGNMIAGVGERFLARMMDVHPGIAPALARARFWAGTLELQWLLGGIRSGDPSWFAVHIGRARDLNG